MYELGFIIIAGIWLKLLVAAIWFKLLTRCTMARRVLKCTASNTQDLSAFQMMLMEEMSSMASHAQKQRASIRELAHDYMTNKSAPDMVADACDLYQKVTMCSLADTAEVEALVPSAEKAMGQVDILVANAGTIRRAPAADHSDEDWDHVIDVNLRSQFVMAREIGKQMIKRGHGKIVFTASLLSFQGGITVPGYAASKGAIAQLTKALANEWAGKGINVNAIAPGYIATDNTAALRADETRNNAILARIPAGRWGTPEDLSGALVFLCSEAANYVQGTVLTVDGGWMGR